MPKIQKHVCLKECIDQGDVKTQPWLQQTQKNKSKVRKVVLMMPVPVRSGEKKQSANGYVDPKRGTQDMHPNSTNHSLWVTKK